MRQDGSFCLWLRDRLLICSPGWSWTWHLHGLPPEWWHLVTFSFPGGGTRGLMHAGKARGELPEPHLFSPCSVLKGTCVKKPERGRQVRIQTEAKYAGIWHCIRDTYRQERVWGFYRGLSLPVCTVSLVSSVSFGTYHHCLAHIFFILEVSGKKIILI